MARALCSRSSVEAGQKCVKLKGQKKSYILLANGIVVSLAPSKIKLEEREFVAAGASMHMISMKDLNSAEMETVKVSRIPILVVTAHGEMQTHE